MLRYLSIRQLAVIDALEVEFAPGLNVLTGETGAGKSVIVEAVDLLLGGRASADLVRTGSETSQVQAVLETPEARELIVRREVSSSGRSRAFVDGALVSSAQLREATGPLVDLHGQHEHQALLAPQHHLRLLDRFASLDGGAEVAADAHAAYSRLRDALEACQLDEHERRAKLDLLTFQRAEIDRVKPRGGEDEELTLERQRLANADRIHRLATDAYAELYEGDAPVLGALGHVWKRVADLAELDPQFAPYLDARDPIRSQLEDLSHFLRSYVAGLDASPERLQQVEDRLAQLERVKRRHGPTLQDVLARRRALEVEIEVLSTTAERAAVLEQELGLARRRFLEVARALSADRRKAADRLSQAVTSGLEELSIPRSRFEVRFQAGELPESQWTPAGVDAAEFYFSANPGEAPRPLARVASGGELSRIMLALKTLATTDAVGKTLIFDEVDSGIGGGVADIVGERLRALGARFQVLCITHLPQVAAHAHAHYRVTKSVARNRTVTAIERLHQGARVEELARMIGGTGVTAAVLAGAEEMLIMRAKGEQSTKGESERARAKGRS
jgi:DNA repair protein RecN (Recombination protein N)